MSEKPKSSWEPPKNSWDPHRHFFKNGQIVVSMFELDAICTDEQQTLLIKPDEIKGLTITQNEICINFEDCYVKFPIVKFALPIEVRVREGVEEE
jgi:hypothetical protein